MAEFPYIVKKSGIKYDSSFSFLIIISDTCFWNMYDISTC